MEERELLDAAAAAGVAEGRRAAARGAAEDRATAGFAVACCFAAAAFAAAAFSSDPKRGGVLARSERKLPGARGGVAEPKESTDRSMIGRRVGVKRSEEGVAAAGAARAGDGEAADGE